MPQSRAALQFRKTEVLIYLNSFYFGMFACCEMAMGLLKAINLSYTGHTLALDTGVMISFIVFETIRLIMGRASSLADRGRKLPPACQSNFRINLNNTSAGGVII